MTVKATLLAIVLASLPAAAVAATIDVGPQTSTYTGLTRGYYFTAPVDFYITGLFVPTTASSNSQDIAVVRLADIPPLFSQTTNDFTVLSLIRDNSSTEFISANIQFQAGDVVGILGSRGADATNSYGANNYSATIGGNAITLARFGFQDQLRTVDPANVWTESGSSIGRVLFTYELGNFAGAVPEPQSWALMILGFGLVGAAARRRNAAVAA